MTILMNPSIPPRTAPSPIPYSYVFKHFDILLFDNNLLSSRQVVVVYLSSFLNISSFNIVKESVVKWWDMIWLQSSYWQSKSSFFFFVVRSHLQSWRWVYFSKLYWTNMAIVTLIHIIIVCFYLYCFKW